MAAAASLVQHFRPYLVKYVQFVQLERQFAVACVWQYDQELAMIAPTAILSSETGAIKMLGHITFLCICDYFCI